MMIRKTAKNATSATRALTEKEAAALTGRIRKAVDSAWALLLEAQEREAWKALKYASWEAYVKAEFNLSRSRSYQLLDQGRVISAIAEATGGGVQRVGQISARDAAAVKDELPATTAEIGARIEQGEAPQKAATDVIAEKRAAKEKAKVENERLRDEHHAALPDAIKQREQVRADTLAKRKNQTPDGLTARDRVSELEEEVRVLEAENASFRVEIEKFGPMRVQFEQGGFEKIIAGKDEEIRVLKTRVYRESEDKAEWAKSSKFWRKQAVKLGYSSDGLIPVEPTSDEVITLDV